MPQQFSIVHAIRGVHVTVKDGRIMQLDSDTEYNLILSRLLNLLSLESLSKFLTFDFSSVGKKDFHLMFFKEALTYAMVYYSHAIPKWMDHWRKLIWTEN